MSKVHFAHPPAVAEAISQLRAAGCVFAEDEAKLLSASARSSVELRDLVDRRTTGVPLEQLLGWVEFAGARIRLAAHVFVPRRRTELLVRQASRLTRDIAAPIPVIVELCCGSGAVGAVLHTAHPAAELHLVEIDARAVDCARSNLGNAAILYHGNLYDPLPQRLRSGCDLVVANAPYVPTDCIALLPAEARLYEPHLALDGGPDGLTVVRRVVSEAPQWLAPGGSVLVESSRRQAPLVAAAMRAAHLIAEVTTSDELDATVVIGRQPDTR